MHDENEMATFLNNFFASVFTNQYYIPVQLLNGRRTEKMLDGILITVTCTIENIKTNKSSRSDKITHRILKEVKHLITKPLSILLNNL